MSLTLRLFFVGLLGFAQGIILYFLHKSYSTGIKAVEQRVKELEEKMANQEVELNEAIAEFKLAGEELRLVAVDTEALLVVLQAKINALVAQVAELELRPEYDLTDEIAEIRTLTVKARALAGQGRDAIDGDAPVEEVTPTE